MAGIMIPISMSQGVQRAREDNQADQRFAMDQEYNKRRLEGLDLQQRQSRMQIEDMERDRPIKDLQRKAQMTSEMAKQAWAMLNIDPKTLRPAQKAPAEWGNVSAPPKEWGAIPDEQVNAFMAKFLTDTPIFGKVSVMPDGVLSDGKSAFQMDRDSALKVLFGMAYPEKAMELAQREQQYINEKGKVETMTAGEAQERGLGLATDKVESYGLNKARIEDRDAEENARLGLDAKRAQIAASNRAHREKPDDMQFVSPDGKTAKTMDRKQGLEMGWTPMADYKATAALQGGEVDPYAFSKQTPDAIRKGIFEQSMMDKGYTPVETFTAMGATVEWKTPDGKPVPPEEVRAANAMADEALGILSQGQARDPVDAMRRVKAKLDAPPVQGAQKAPDGNWYVQKDGKWFRVRQ